MTSLDLAYRIVISDRIHDLWQRREWYRSHLGWIPAQRTEDMAELRLLVRLAREARRVARKADEQRDPLTMGKGWTESERAFAMGR